MRYLLTGYGVDLHENVRGMRTTATELQQRAGNLITTLPQEKFEDLDEVIQRVSGIEGSLEDVVRTISMDVLEELAGGDWTELRRRLQNAKSALGDLANAMRKATKMVEGVEAGADRM